MINNNYICALDIGSSKISAVVAKLKNGKISDIYLESISSKGVKDGAIVDSIELISSLGRVLGSLRTHSGLKIKSVYVNISGYDISTKHSYALIPLAERGNKVVTAYDIQKVNEQARILGSSLEDEIIHQIPYSYSIDLKKNIVNPLGLYSHRLEVDLYLICAKISSLQALSRVVNQAGFELKGVFLAGLASSAAIFNKELKSGVTVFCDIGGDIAELLVFKDGTLRDMRILRLGGDILTHELSKTLGVPLELAEDVKRSHISLGDHENLDENREILVKKGSLYRPIKQKVAVEIATAKAKFICNQIKDNLQELAALREINNFVVTGRTTLLAGFLEMIEATLGMPVRIGKVHNSELQDFVQRKEALSGHKYLTFLTSLGIICQAMHKEGKFPSNPIKDPARNPLLKAINRVKEVYQEYF